MFILVTPEKMKLTGNLRPFRSSIIPFSSFNSLVLRYTDPKNGLVNKHETHAGIFSRAFEHVPFDRTFLYRTNLSQVDLMSVKLQLSFACKVYITTEKFIDSILPLLDLMTLTTSTKPNVEMDMWLPTDDKEHIEKIVGHLTDKSIDVKALMKRMVQLYNAEAPQTLHQLRGTRLVQQRQTQQDDKDIWNPISRNFIAHQIRLKLIIDNIKKYSAHTMREFEQAEPPNRIFA